MLLLRITACALTPLPAVDRELEASIDTGIAYAQSKAVLRRVMAQTVVAGFNISVTKAELLRALAPARLQDILQQRVHTYAAASPFPHATFDGILPDVVLAAVDFEQAELQKGLSGCHPKA